MPDVMLSWVNDTINIIYEGKSDLMGMKGDGKREKRNKEGGDAEADSVKMNQAIASVDSQIEEDEQPFVWWCHQMPDVMLH